MNREKVEGLIRELLIEIGEDPNRQGLIDTPKRVAKMYEEIYEGIKYTNEEIAKMFTKTFDEDIYDVDCKDLVVIKDIYAFSMCEHHLALMYNMKVHVAYVPTGSVIGLSKVARVVDMVTKRLQLQERIGSDIADIIEMITQSPDVAVIVEGEHSCMTMRGIKRNGSSTISSTMRGRFMENGDLRHELLSMI